MRRVIPFFFAVFIAHIAAGQVQELQTTFKTARGQQIHCDVYKRPAGGKRPAVVILHGGAGFTIRAADWRKYATSLADHGYIALVPHYFEATGSTTIDRKSVDPETAKQWIAAVSDAITFASEFDGVDNGKIGLVGFSLGAFAAIAEASADKRVRAIVEYYGGMNGLLPPGKVTLPPTLILHGDQDTIVPVEQAYKLKSKLEEQKTAYEIKIYPGKGHAFDASDPSDAWDRTVAFLDKHLRGD